MNADSVLNQLRQRLEAFIQAESGASISIDEMMPLPGGASRDTWMLSGVLGNEPVQLVLRRDLETSMVDTALSRAEEFQVMQAAFEAGVMVPRPRWHSADATLLGKPFFIMDYVEGVSIGVKVVRAPELEAARQRLPDQLGEQLAQIHMLEPLPFLQGPPAGVSPAQAAVAAVRGMIDHLGIHNPAIELGLVWAEENAPACEQMTLVHGDYRVGNLLVGTEGLNAIVDWEFCHVGDPAEDLAWPCVRDWRFGNGRLHFAGIGERDAFLTAYERASGRRVDRRAVDYWEILGNLRWAATCLSQANRHLSGADPSVELASLGRRSVEMQMEMLRLIGRYAHV